MTRIYLDYNATAPPCAAVIDAVAAALRCAANPSSIHAPGQRARAMVDEARDEVAALIGARVGDLVLTSGGTEADNLALRGVVIALDGGPRRRIVVSAIEHEAVLETARALEREGWTVTTVTANAHGEVTEEALGRALTSDTALVSVMHANNETGVIQPIPRLAARAHQVGAIFHTDAVQACGKVPVDVEALGVDLLSLSAHKFGGPPGAGALWIRPKTPLVAQLTGGRQERNRRAGTENVPAIAGMGAAARVARDRLHAESARQRALRDQFESAVAKMVPRVVINGVAAARVPNTSNLAFEGVEAESLVIALDLEGIAVSAGAACSSGTLEPSHVLRAMGLPEWRVQGAIRVSLGPDTTAEEIERASKVLSSGVERLRRRLG